MATNEPLPVPLERRTSLRRRVTSPGSSPLVASALADDPLPSPPVAAPLPRSRWRRERSSHTPSLPSSSSLPQSDTPPPSNPPPGRTPLEPRRPTGGMPAGMSANTPSFRESGRLRRESPLHARSCAAAMLSWLASRVQPSPDGASSSSRPPPAQDPGGQGGSGAERDEALGVCQVDGNGLDALMGSSRRGSAIMLMGDSLAELVECPICLERLVPPIYQCRNGHVICHVCDRQLSSCPVCRSQLDKIRNRALEALTAADIVSCSFLRAKCNPNSTDMQGNVEKERLSWSSELLSWTLVERPSKMVVAACFWLVIVSLAGLMFQGNSNDISDNGTKPFTAEALAST